MDKSWIKTVAGYQICFEKEVLPYSSKQTRWDSEQL